MPEEYRGRMPKPRLTLLGYAELADMLDTTVPTVRTYLAKARKHRREGTPRPGDMPEPDATVGLSPVWKAATIERWLDSRPGAGNGNRPNWRPAGEGVTTRRAS
jgi:hypothetical protein